jgi:hypothetical protein
MVNYIINFFKQRKAKKQRIKAKTESLISDYELLIAEFKLIKENNSNLSSTQRKNVVSKVKHLIEKGHITDGAMRSSGL